MNRKVRLGVIGTGHMGQYHVNVARQLTHAELTGIYDADPERARLICEKHSTKPFSDIDSLLAEVDAVVVAVPTFLHYEISRKALLAGKHVLVEKPISETIDQAKELIQMSREKDLVFQVGHIERFNGAVLELGKIIRNPLLIESRRLSPFNPRIRDVGVVLDMMIHDIDIVLNLVKTPVKSIHARGNRVLSDHEDIASVVISFENGCIANMNASRCTQAKIRTLNISEEDAYVFLDFADQEIELHRQASSNTLLGQGEIKYKQESIVEKIFVHKDNPLKQEHEHFVNCILDSSIKYIGGDSDIRTLEVAHKILEEIHQGL